MNEENKEQEETNQNEEKEASEQASNTSAGDTQESPDDRDISVDEEWKEQVKKEKEKLKEQKKQGGGARQEYPDASFSTIIGGIGIQAAISLGQVENPATGETSVDLEQAKHFIDSLKILQDKTQGNLNKQEKNHLQSLLSELQMQYVQRAKQGSGAADDSGSQDSAQQQSGDGQQNIYTPPGT